MKQYLLSVYQPEGGTPAAEVLDQVMRDVDVLNQELKATGAWVFAGGLHPSSTATVVRLNDGDMLVTDGPFVEGKEHIGGFWVIKAPDLDVALEWGRKAALACTVPIEVRPFQEAACAFPTSRPFRPQRSNVYFARSTVALSRSWFASSGTSTSPRKPCRTLSPRRCNGGPHPGCPRVPRDGSSRRLATGRSIAFAGSRPGRTAMRKPRCCMPATNPRTTRWRKGQ